MTELVHLTIDGDVATIELDSEHNRNALSRQLMTELSEHLRTVDDNPTVRAVLLRSAGRVFCSGADLSEARSGAMTDGTTTLLEIQRQILTLAKPVVVRLAGPVRAGGLGLVGAADIVVAAQSVSFALTEVRLGLAPAVISLTLLPKLDPRIAADVSLTARTFDAAEARQMGLVSRVAADELLDSAVDNVLADLAKGSPQGLRETKKLLNADLLERFDARGSEVAALSARLFGSDEAREAMAAFLSKS